MACPKNPLAARTPAIPIHSSDWGSAFGSQSFCAPTLSRTFAGSEGVAAGCVCMNRKASRAASITEIIPALAAPRLEPADQQLAFVNDFTWQVIMQINEELFVANHFGTPGSAVYSLQLFELLTREIETLPFNVFVPGHPADRRLTANRAAPGAVDDPLQHAHVLTKAGPDKVAIFILAEPVHVKNAGC